MDLEWTFTNLLGSLPKMPENVVTEISGDYEFVTSQNI